MYINQICDNFGGYNVVKVSIININFKLNLISVSILMLLC